MDANIIEMGRVSSRGQIAIPSDIRRGLGLTEGSKVLFIMKDDAVMMKKVTAASFADLTKPLRDSKKKITEDEVVGLVHKIRKSIR
ncbi:MAG: AbrB/MazE/SpoVT family DNA-binding domain-containing protein [Candidatus Altiarchaeota archaeon]